MSSCLGIYIDENIIKYAKVQKDKDIFKVEAFGVKFYEKIDEVLEQIISETYSYKTPISINISGEMYNYFNVFSLLAKQDIKKAVEIEFDMLADEKGYERDKIESKYILTKNLDDPEKLKAMYISMPKNELNRELLAFEKYKVVTATPISITNANLIKNLENEENCVIIDIEDETNITTILDGQVNNVDKIPEGMKKILSDINRKENSLTKAYEICKNTTIYTQAAQGLQSEENEYLEDIMPTLYKIVTSAKRIIDNSLTSISKVYITGTGAVINNIDIYFQEYISNCKCEILKPFFVESSSIKISIKDYIEVNSAIALALEGIEGKNKDLNFSNKSGGINLDLNQNVKFTLKGEIDSLEKLLLRIVAIMIITIVGYGLLANSVSNKIYEKRQEATRQLAKVNAEIAKVDSDITKINSQATTYTRLIKNLEETNTDKKTKYLTKDAIPNLLSRIMSSIPQQVQITSIKNTSGTHIIIEAQSPKYEQLGFFKAALVDGNILKNIKSTSGVKQDSVIKVTIEGELP